MGNKTAARQSHVILQWNPKIAMCKEADTMNVYNTSCPISSPSLNSEFDSNFQVSSTPDKLFYNYLNK